MIIVPFKPHHIAGIDLREYDRLTFSCLNNLEDKLKEVCRWGPAYTGIINGKIIGAAGIILFWRGVGEVWMIGSKHLSNHKIEFHKTILRSLPVLTEGMEIKRLQGIISLNFPEKIKWLKSVGFEEEGILRSHGTDGSDCSMLARVF